MTDTTAPTLDEVLASLEGVKPVRPRPDHGERAKWQFSCVAHRDVNASAYAAISVRRTTRDGQHETAAPHLVISCSAHCTRRAIETALGTTIRAITFDPDDYPPVGDESWGATFSAPDDTITAVRRLLASTPTPAVREYVRGFGLSDEEFEAAYGVQVGTQPGRNAVVLAGQTLTTTPSGTTGVGPGLAQARRTGSGDGPRWLPPRALVGMQTGIAGVFRRADCGLEEAPDRIVYVTEGLSDAFAVCHVKRVPAVAVRGASNHGPAAVRQVASCLEIVQADDETRFYREGRTDRAEITRRRVVVAGDNDEAGAIFSTAMTEGLGRLGYDPQPFDWSTKGAA